MLQNGVVMADDEHQSDDKMLNDLGTDSHLDYDALVWRQIDRNSFLLSKGFYEAFFDGILNLASVVIPYSDKKFRETWLKLEKEFYDLVKRTATAQNPDVISHKKKFLVFNMQSQVVLLLDRNGRLPRGRVEGSR